jgi:hypothetical protein
MKEHFNGSIKNGTKKRVNWKVSYAWNICTETEVLSFIIRILPYLVIKENQAKVAIEYMENKYTVPGEIYYQKMKELNKRGEDGSE